MVESMLSIKLELVSFFQIGQIVQFEKKLEKNASFNKNKNQTIGSFPFLFKNQYIIHTFYL